MTEQEKAAAAEKEKQAAAELEKKVGEAGSSEEVRDLMIQARDDKGQFTAEKKPAAAAAVKTDEEKKADEVAVYTHKAMIGGKEVEFIGADAADVLRQVTAAMTAYDIAKTPAEVKKDPPKPAVTPEELTALGLRISQGDMKAMEEYLEKSGTLDRYLEKKGIKVDEVKKVLDTQATASVREKWDTEVKAFLAESDWPGGTQNEYILKTKLAQLKDANGQPLAYNPSKENLQRAYEAMKTEGLVFKVEANANTETAPEQQRAAAASGTSQEQSTAKKKPTSSTLLGTSGESTTRKTETKATAKLPEITPEMSGREIMEAFKNYAIANNLNPDDVLRGAAKA